VIGRKIPDKRGIFVSLTGKECFIFLVSQTKRYKTYDYYRLPTRATSSTFARFRIVLILTHAHRDHFDGIQVLLDNDVTVDKVWESKYERRTGDNSIDYDEWQEYQGLVRKLNATVYQPERSLSWFDTIGRASFQFYNPTASINEDDQRHIHDASLAFNILIEGTRIAFTGDASDRWQTVAEDDQRRGHPLEVPEKGSADEF